MLAVLNCSFNPAPTWLGAEAQWGVAGSVANFFPGHEPLPGLFRSPHRVAERTPAGLLYRPVAALGRLAALALLHWRRRGGGGVSAARGSLQQLTAELSNAPLVARP